jgi:hypothetical protein
LAVLGALIFALWYDYKVARPAVETAFDTISKFNETTNTSGGRKFLKNTDIQDKLNREPTRTYDEGDFHVEVYSWRSGLPIRSHNYYAVYQRGTPLVFLKHFKYEVPPDEFAATMAPQETGGIDEPPPDVGSPISETRPDGEEGAKPATDYPPEAQPAQPAEGAAGDAAPKQPAADSATEPADAKPAEAKPADAKPADAKAEEAAPPAVSPPASSDAPVNAPTTSAPSEPAPPR